MKKLSFFTYSHPIVSEKLTGKQSACQAHQSISSACQAHQSASYTNYSSRSKVRCENDSQNTALRSHQPSLLPAIAPTVRSYFEIAPVPQQIALAPDRFYIWLVKDFERWNIPIQFSELEARSLLPLVEDECDWGFVLAIVELAMIAGGAS